VRGTDETPEFAPAEECTTFDQDDGSDIVLTIEDAGRGMPAISNARALIGRKLGARGGWPACASACINSADRLKSNPP
jgi:hypothetical protein